MRVISETNRPEAAAVYAVPGAVVFEPRELRPWVMSTIAGIIRKLHGRLPRVVRIFISAEKLIELALALLQKEALPGSPSVIDAWDPLHQEL